MNLAPLTNDLVFKSVFVRNPDLLISLINAVLFEDKEKFVTEIEILNPELPTSFSEDKRSVLDIRAKDNKGNIFHVEMQVAHQSVFIKRSIFYLAGLIRDQLKSSNSYLDIKPVYQINILDFKLIPSQNFLSRFKFREERNHDLTLTDDLEIVFIELPKFEESSNEIASSLEAWTFFIKNAHSLLEADMEIVIDKLPDLKHAYAALEHYSADPVERKRLEDKINSNRDFAYDLAYNYEQGKLEGEMKGELRGKMEGEMKAKVVTAKSLLANGVDIDLVIRATGLTLEELKLHGVL